MVTKIKSFTAELKKHPSGTHFINIPKTIIDNLKAEKGSFLNISLVLVQKPHETIRDLRCVECCYGFSSDEHISNEELTCPACGGKVEEVNEDEQEN